LYAQIASGLGGSKKGMFLMGGGDDEDDEDEDEDDGSVNKHKNTIE